jgi:integrase
MDVKLGVDKGILRLQFSTRVSRDYFGKRQFYRSLGRPNNPYNRQWGLSICQKIQLDIDHPDNLFDPTLKKYLANTKSYEPRLLPTLETLYKDYVKWKIDTGRISETTLKTRYERMYWHWLTPFLKEPVNPELVSRIAKDLKAKNLCKINLKKLFSALSEMGERAVRKGFIIKNYFYELKEIDLRIVKKSSQLAEEENYKAFTLEERDLIVDTFKNSPKKSDNRIADLIEFLFLTGCRLGEAFALKWNDIKEKWIVFDESYSSETKITKETKTKVTRIFKTKGYPKLIQLIERVKKNSPKATLNDYVFQTLTGEQYDRAKVSALWYGRATSKNGKPYFSEGIVTKLAKQGKISQYLKPSSTRHTFITLQAQAGVDLKLLADSCGNSVDTIYSHYLGVDRNATFFDL